MSSLKSLKATNLMVTKRNYVVLVCWNGRNEIHRFDIRLNNKLKDTNAIFAKLFNRLKIKKYNSTFANRPTNSQPKEVSANVICCLDFLHHLICCVVVISHLSPYFGCDFLDSTLLVALHHTCSMHSYFSPG
jgi:hypothetical protein